MLGRLFRSQSITESDDTGAPSIKQFQLPESESASDKDEKER